MKKYYFTREEYINNYEQMLAGFLSLHVDNDVEDFIRIQIREYKYALNFIDLIVVPARHEKLPMPVDLNLFWNLMEYFNITNHRIKNYKDFADSFENKRFVNVTKIVFNKKYGELVNSWKKIILFLEKNEEDKQKIISGSQKSLSTTNQIFDNNNFNEKGYNLFLYLVDNYDKRDKIKFINIFYYLTYYADKNTYFFKFTQNSYTAFILQKYSVEPKSFKKDVFDNSSEMYTLSSHEEVFRSK